jgi:hypothetical protein
MTHASEVLADFRRRTTGLPAARTRRVMGRTLTVDPSVTVGADSLLKSDPFNGAATFLRPAATPAPSPSLAQNGRAFA